MNRANIGIKVLGAVAMFAVAQSAWAVTCTTVSKQDWNQATWTGAGCTLVNGQPPTGATVVIGTGANILVDRNTTTTVSNITIGAGGTLAVKTNNTLTLSGNLTNNGTFTPGGGTVALVGTAMQTITGTFSFANLTLTNPAGVTITGNVTITGTFTPGTTPITVPAGSSLTVGGVTYTGPCTTGAYGPGFCPVAAVANFDAIETALTYTPNAVAPARNPLYTKLAGTAFSVDVVALQTGGTVMTTYAKSVTVELVDASSPAATCATYPALVPAVSQALTFVAGTGRKTTANMTVAKSYPALAVRVTDATVVPNVVACSADKFAVRPLSLTLSATGLNADTTGASATAAPVVKAGAGFALTTTASDAGYTGTPTIAAAAAHAGAVRAGALTGMFAAAVAGVANGTFAYDEAGYFMLNANALQDATFTATDNAVGDCTADFSTVLSAGGQYGCNVGSAASVYFGRFIPDHFVLTPGAVTPANNGFTYFGQDGFATAFTLTAQNAANATTQNYSGAYAKLGLATWGNFAFSAAGLPAGAVFSASATAPSGTWSKGVTSALSATHQVSRPANPAAITNVTVSALPVDADGVTLPAATAVTATATPLYFGQIKLSSVHGSELTSLPVLATVQYCNAVVGTSCTDWRTNALDTQTALVAPFFNTSNPSPAGFALTIGAPGTISNGQIKIKIASSAKAKGNIDLTAQSPAWLPGSNTARATFGVYKGSNEFIYLRESY